MEAGAPVGLVHDSRFDHAQTEAAIGHPAIAGVSFTGGDTAGAAIARAAGAADKLRGILRSAVERGIEVRGDRSELDRTGREFSPQIVIDPPHDHAVWTQELFGPVAILVPAGDVEEAIALANDSAYGLGATVYTSDASDGVRFAAEIESGMVALNGPKGGNPAYPFGGVKRSGFGRELGALGIREFSNQQLIVEHSN